MGIQIGIRIGIWIRIGGQDKDKEREEGLRVRTGRER